MTAGRPIDPSRHAVRRRSLIEGLVATLMFPLWPHTSLPVRPAIVMVDGWILSEADLAEARVLPTRRRQPNDR